MPGHDAAKKFVPPAVAASILGVSTSTVRHYAANGQLSFIRTPGGQRRYNIEDVVRVKGGVYKQSAGCLANLSQHASAAQVEAELQTQGAVYARVSSKKQEDDLKRQITALKEAYPGYKVFQDICSGLNYKRKGLTRLLEQVQRGTIKTVVVAHKDRLARFATEVIEWIINQAGGRLIIQSSDGKCPEQELTEDLMAIVHVFSCRLNGKRGGSGQKGKGKRQAENSEPSEALPPQSDFEPARHDDENVLGLQEDLQHRTSLRATNGLSYGRVSSEVLQQGRHEVITPENVCELRGHLRTSYVVPPAPDSQGATPTGSLQPGGTPRCPEDEDGEAGLLTYGVPRCSALQEQDQVQSKVQV